MLYITTINITILVLFLTTSSSPFKFQLICALMTGFVVVFDFDKTIIDCDSDNWVVDQLGATDLFNDLLPTMPWNTLMDRMMHGLHSQGKTVDEIAESLKTAPLHPKVVSAIKSAHALGCDLRIVSDANLFFVQTVLRHHGVMECFSEINTNPSYVDEVGRLRIFPYHASPHGCACDDLCPPNMCKGLVIERIKAEVLFVNGEKRFVYLGDGKGDFCPSTKLGEEDFVMPRKNYPVWELICDKPSAIKAEVHEWRDWDEQERILLHLINNGVGVSTSSIPPTDCRLQTINPIAAPNALQQAV